MVRCRARLNHVFFIDIVGYSKLLITEQTERLQKLKEIVWATEQFKQAQAEGKLLRLPTGDGGALVFRNRDRDGKPVRQDPRRPALVAVPAQDRQGTGPAREDRVQGDAAAREVTSDP